MFSVKKKHRPEVSLTELSLLKNNLRKNTAASLHISVKHRTLVDKLCNMSIANDHTLDILFSYYSLIVF